ncbi:MCD-domain-containing protein [Conidiobolus coronatus NRRL 28638]|uniref:MCD-domain-containing protein n=1 Tax=Conidiobolus coronatus (strain ATCC 28846 / CBS 209.66 / NRRL 28638) TaxID=796925 RepID=A0A137PBD8_CONC2|nr:MCD-domain-containing protein [Conidiobolus coronatus NRRL 28638]|eukprot:KXN72242.1 MCD-domain-containing protein [Conidiobolus coronatus NRRL 28638]
MKRLLTNYYRNINLIKQTQLFKTSTYPSIYRNLSTINNNINKPGSVASNEIKTYWEDLNLVLHEPGFETFGSLEMKPPTKTLTELLKNCTSITNSGVGDLLPSLSAKQICQTYENLDIKEKLKFLIFLVKEFGVSREESIPLVRDYIDKYNTKENNQVLSRLEQTLKQCLTPKYVRFFDQVLRLPNGMEFLVKMRKDTLAIYKTTKDKDLLTFSNYLKDSLQSSLIGYLRLDRITWNSSAFTMEKMMEYEYVHPFKDWDDMKQRLGPGRRVFGFFHKSMSLDPLVYIQVALLKNIASNVPSILNDPTAGTLGKDNITAAIFYSINTQKGLSGVDLGSFLIKRVVEELKSQFPNLTTFCTLSPIPGLRDWILSKTEETDLLTRDEFNQIKSLNQLESDKEVLQAIKEYSTNFSWLTSNNQKAQAVLEPIFMRLASRYLIIEKKGKYTLNPVANFHIRNGACIHRLNWMGDLSNYRLEESLGIMVNYNYLQHRIEQVNETYLVNATVPVSNPDLYNTYKDLSKVELFQ